MIFMCQMLCNIHLARLNKIKSNQIKVPIDNLYNVSFFIFKKFLFIFLLVNYDHQLIHTM